MQKGLVKKYPPKTLGTKVSYETGTGPGGQRATGIGLDEHKGYTYMRLDGYRARQSLIGLGAHCANSYIPHV